MVVQVSKWGDGPKIRVMAVTSTPANSAPVIRQVTLNDLAKNWFSTMICQSTQVDR